MILSFIIEYRTNWGEEVRISGLFRINFIHHRWYLLTAELELEVPQEGMTINYSYQIETKRN